MIDAARKFLCVLLTISCLLCLVLLAGTGSMYYLVGVVGLGFLANWVYPMKRKWNRRGK